MKLKPWGCSDLVASFQQLKFIEIGTGTGMDRHDGHGDGMDGQGSSPWEQDGSFPDAAALYAGTLP